MDGNRFDEITRALASRGSRRAVLRGLLGFGGVVAGTGLTGEADARVIGTKPTIAPVPPAATTTPAPATTPAPDPCPGQVNCSVDGCCSGSCTARGRCCPAGWSICGNECCATPAQCCDNECCADGHICIGEEMCCPAPLFCGGVCCNGAGQQCCGDRCLSAGQCCTDEQCPDSPDTCQAGVCHSAANMCGLSDQCADAPGSTCCSGVCVPLGTTTNCLACGDVCGENETCTGEGCVTIGTTPAPASTTSSPPPTSTTVAPPVTTTTMAPTTTTTIAPIPCSIDDDCESFVCRDDGTCCPAEFGCSPIDECCIPDEQNPYSKCCPGPGMCCDCFFDSRDFTLGFCYDPTSSSYVLCGDTVYLTSHYLCVGDRGVVRSHVCADGEECPGPCCGGSGSNGSGPGGVCCDAGQECSNNVCITANRTCNESTVSEDCLTGETCATRGDQAGNGTCCPAHRSYRNTLAEDGGAPIPYLDCCSSEEQNQPSQEPGGHPFCSRFVELGTTSNKTWTRR